MHACAQRKSRFAGVQHDSMLYSYLLDPTYSSHRLPDVALRRFNLKLERHRWRRPPTLRASGHGAAPGSRTADLRKLYEEIDLPLVPVLARMEQAGVKIDREVLAEMSSRLEGEIERQGARNLRMLPDCEFNINSPKQLGDVLFNKLNLPKPVKYGKGKTISTAVDVLEGLAANARRAAPGA